MYIYIHTLMASEVMYTYIIYIYINKYISVGRLFGGNLELGEDSNFVQT